MTDLESKLERTLSRMANLEKRIHVLESTFAKTSSADDMCAKVAEAVSVTMGVTVSDMMTRTKVARICWARMVAMHLCRALTKRSLFEVGRHFGRDHGTVTHANRAVRNQLEVDPVFRAQVQRCTSAALERLTAL